MRTIIVAGGGTGGHLFPAIGICEMLGKAKYRAYLITDQRREGYLPQNLPFEHQIITVTRFSKNPIKFLKTLIKNIQAFRSAYQILRSEKPIMVIGCGGYTMIPLIVAAYFLKIKIILHEQNAVVGRANLFFSRIADKLFISFMHTINLPQQENKIVWAGMPITEKILSIDIKGRNFMSEQFIIIVTGGSQGAEVFDFLIPEAIKLLKKGNPNVNLKVIQQIRNRSLDEIKTIYEDLKIEYELSTFFKDIEKKYAQAHLLIGRAGSSTVAELISCTLPAILIPFPTAKANHQLYNAMNLVEHKASWYIEQKLLTADKLGKLIHNLYTNRQSLITASNKLSSLQVDTSKIVVEEINKIIDKTE